MLEDVTERGDTPRGVREHVQHPKKQMVLASADSLGSEFIGADEGADEDENDKRTTAIGVSCSDECKSDNAQRAEMLRAKITAYPIQLRTAKIRTNSSKFEAQSRL